MEYISLIDELELDLESITNLTENKIIRLQKQLKAKAVLNNAANLGELAAIIDQLKYDDYRNNYLFVESHIWLKDLLIGNFTGLNPNTIIIDLKKVDDIEALKKFLTPYLKPQIKAFITKALKHGEYLLFYKITKQQTLFSEEIIQDITNFLRSKLAYATSYIERGLYKEKQHVIAFLSKPNFINALNTYCNSLSVEISELNSAIVTMYNKYNRDIRNQNFKFAAQIMVAFGNLDLNNPLLKELIDNNAAIAQKYTTNNSSRKHKTSSDSSSSGTMWGIAVFIFIIIRIVIAFSNNNGSSYTPSYKPSIVNENWKTIIEEAKTKYRMKGKPLRILQTLKSTNTISTSSTNKLSVPIHLRPFSNPYITNFNEFYQPLDKNEINESYTYVHNKTGKELILFRLYQDNSKALFLPDNEKMALQIGSGDTLAFYTGTNFMSDQFKPSHFTQNNYMSSLYLIEDVDIKKPHHIDVYRETESLRKDEDAKGDIWHRDSIVLTNIKYQKYINF